MTVCDDHTDQKLPNEQPASEEARKEDTFATYAIKLYIEAVKGLIWFSNSGFTRRPTEQVESSNLCEQ